ncbi:PspC domain-containing protein [Anaerobacillus sp. CMMVII]|uniref:PspC domain-containing protein n=1 Tax=Anaerobacillus sp. CMMVII TaxID=2755588 RepID=UPI0028E0A3F2|nr:PspC domain-containing protein [Anaerobacillus sp. CMMVII]
MKVKRLVRTQHDRKLTGVCGGLGQYFNIDPTIVRILFLILIIPTAFFTMPIAYLVATMLIPNEQDVR